METCPCGNESYERCCKPYHSGEAAPETAEGLMRSRYSAFVKAQIGYLEETLHPAHRSDFDRKATESWARESEWNGLKILKASGGPNDKNGEVEFVAAFSQNGIEHSHHEVSTFKSLDGRWYFVSGRIIPEPGKVFQNDPCPCGSGKKYKRCCGSKGSPKKSASKS